MLRMGVVLACVLTSVRVGVAIIVELAVSSARHDRRRVVGPGSLSMALRRIARPVAVVGLGVGVASSTVMVQPAAATARATDVATAASPVGEIPGFVDGAGVVDAPPSASGAGSSFAEMRRVRIELASFGAHDDRPDEPEVWVVEPGDHLWSIAAETLTEHLGKAPSERRVARYWQRLIDANRDRLVIPGEPDVIMPGQRLVLPRPAAGSVQRSGT
jgi:hypothetical protein